MNIHTSFNIYFITAKSHYLGKNTYLCSRFAIMRNKF